ncbi:MAG TPA: M48 family metallopeptidase [Bryobacteraceae bacterium]|jgi:predicted Zn-dependent protease
MNAVPIRSAPSTIRRVLAGLALSTAIAFAAPDDSVKKDPEAIGTRKVDGGINFYSVEKEIALGKQLAIEVQRQAKLLEDPIVNEYINRLTQNLTRNSDVKFPVTVKVIDDDVINAFTLPGGFLFVNTGLIRLSESESELASAISHELGHVAARHYTRQVSRGDLINGASIPLIFLGGIPGMAARELAQIGLPMGMFKFSRDFETEADVLGIQYLYKTGYDPTAAIDMFERVAAMQQKQPGAVSQLFNTHPLTTDRIAKTQKNIEQNLPARAEYVVNTSEYEEMRTRLIGLQERRKVNEKPAPTLMVKPGESKDERPTLKRPE